MLYIRYSAHMATFLANCKFIQEKDGYTAYPLDFSYLTDFDTASMAELMDIVPRYTGVGSWCEEVTPREASFSHGRLPGRTFTTADFDGVMDLDKCSTSWATQAVKIAEKVAGNNVKFSAYYLFKCMSLM